MLVGTAEVFAPQRMQPGDSGLKHKMEGKISRRWEGSQSWLRDMDSTYRQHKTEQDSFSDQFFDSCHRPVRQALIQI